MLYENSEFLTDNLKPDQKKIHGKLIRFFRDIDEGDRLSGESSESVKEYENVLNFYMHARDQAKSLPSIIDIQFISTMRINKIQDKIDQLETERREKSAAIDSERTRTKTEVSKKSGLELALEKVPPDDIYEPDIEMDLGIREFSRKNYDLAMTHFIKGFRKQMINLSKGGRDQVRGILGIPIACRAEVIFLVELYKLRDKKNRGDIVDIQDGLDAISSRLENREGLWAIVRDASKRKRISQHISGLDPDSL